MMIASPPTPDLQQIIAVLLTQIFLHIPPGTLLQLLPVSFVLRIWGLSPHDRFGE